MRMMAGIHPHYPNATNGAERASTKRNADGTYAACIRVGSKIVWECGCHHRNRDLDPWSRSGILPRDLRSATSCAVIEMKERADALAQQPPL